MCNVSRSFRIRYRIGLLLCLLVAGLVLLPSTARAADGLTIVTEADLAPGGKINGTNWMSGISGERRLHEITIPGTHDSGMANVEVGNSVLDFVINRFKWTARTQDLGIDEQLTAGVRMFDLRLTDINPLWEFKEREGLWLCHGPRAAARFLSMTFYSELPEDKRSEKYGNDKFLTLDQTMGYYFGFLKDHPTETVLVSLTNESGAGDQEHIVKLLKEKLKTWREEINPSTGKPYIYQQNKSTNDWNITKMPKLADARGQVVLTTDIRNKDGQRLLDYGIWLATVNGWAADCGIADVRLCFENHFEVSGQDKTEYVDAFYRGANDPQYHGEDANDWDEFLNDDGLKETYSSTLPNYIDHCNYVFTTSNVFMSVLSDKGSQGPKTVAEYVMPPILTDDDALMKTRGVFYGWVNVDFMSESVARTIWLNNYPLGGLAYTTIAFKPGRGTGAETSYNVQTGGQLTFPDNTFVLPDDLKRQGYEFVGWEVAENGRVYQPGQTLGTRGFSTITATAKFEQTWSGVRDAMYSAHQDGLTIKLENDLTAQKGEFSLVVPTWAKVTLNLNGHTIDRNTAGLKLPSSNPNRVIEVGGELSIVGPGIIQGGNAPSGGGITIERLGKLELKDVTLRNNKADDRQSADICVNNEAPTAGPALKVSGQTSVGNGVLLNTGHVIAGVSDLTGDAYLKVFTRQAPTKESPVVISDTLTNGDACLKHLFSGQSYGVERGKDGQVTNKAILTVPYTVSYNLMGGRYPIGEGLFSETIPAELVKYGDTAPRLADPSKTGAGFAGWFRVGESSAYDFSTPVTGDLELEAHWTTEKRTLKFYLTENGEHLNGYDQSVWYGQTPNKPNDPTRDGFDFCGWGTRTGFDRSNVIRFDFNQPLFQSYQLFGVWSPKRHSVTFESNGGSSVSAQTVSHGGSATKPVNPTRDDYLFQGWYKDNETEPYDFDRSVTGDVRLTAHWVELHVTHAVVFDVNGDGVTGEPAKQYVHWGAAVERPTKNPTREGYDFAGWYTDADCKNAYDFASAVKGDLTLYAKWTVKTYKVEFDSNGGSAVGPRTVVHGYSVAKPADPTREGHDFAGWCIDAGCQNAYDFAAAVTGDLNLHAKWTVKSYTVTFDSNGGSAVNEQPVAHGGTVTMPADPTREGYVFAGWYANGTAYDFDTIVLDDLKLTAHWEKVEELAAEQVVVVFNGNGGESVGTQIVSKGGTVTPPTSAPTREGHTFAGWHTDADCQSAYDFASPVNANMVLYAKWSPDNHTVSFVSDGSTVTSLSVPHGSSVTRPNDPTKEGHVFLGWFENGSLYDFARPITGDLELTARWDSVPVWCNVTFKSDGGSEVASQTVKQGGKAKRPANPTREGYVFAGWYNGDALYDFGTLVSADLELTAHWERLDWLVVFYYNYNDGTYDASVFDARIVEHGDKATAPEEAPTREGYDFAGWYTDADCKNAYDFASAVQGDLALYARWTIKKHAVVFDSKGGSAVVTQSVTHGDKATRPADPEREGHTFAGWRIGSATYDFDSPVTADLTLTAQWTAVKLSVTFDVGGGTPAPEAQQVAYGGFATKPSDPSKGNWSFDGWYEDVDLGDVPLSKEEAEQIQNDSTLNPYYWVVGNETDGYTLRVEHDFDSDPVLANTTLHARWIANAHTVSFDLNGALGKSPALQSITHGAKATAPADRPVRNGYAFAGWYTTKTCDEGSSFDFNAPIIGDLILYAGWALDYHVVTFVTQDAETQECQVVRHGQRAARPSDVPVRNGYIFNDWYADEGCSSAFDFDAPITCDTLVYAGWVAKTFTARFDVDGGTPQPSEQTVTYGQKVSEPETGPTKDGRACMGWYVQVTDEPIDADTIREIRSDPDLNREYWVGEDGLLRSRYDFDYIPEEDITLYARYEKCTVTFDADGGSPQPAAQMVSYNESLAKPAEDPTKDGYNFDGWWLEGEDEPFEFGVDVITGDTTLRARWVKVAQWKDAEEEPITHTVVFDSNGGSAVTPQTQKVAYGEVAHKPADPNRLGYVFKGWHEDVSDLISVQEYEEHRDELQKAFDQKAFDSLQVIDGKVMMRYDPASDPVYYDMKVQAQWEPDGLKTEVVLAKGVPTIKESNLDEIARAVVTSDELAQDVIVRLVVKPMDKASVADADKAALEARLKKLEATDYQWLDISLVKIVGDVETKIKALDSPLRFTVEIPKEMRGTNRTYYLIRLHDGKASVVASGASTVLAAKTDRFSPYVLAFKEPSADPGKQSKDPVKRQEPESPESPAPAANRVVSTPVSSSKDSSGNASNRTVTTTQQSKSTATSLPRTGDSMFEHSVLLLAASCIIAVAVRLKCQKGSRPV